MSQSEVLNHFLGMEMMLDWACKWDDAMVAWGEYYAARKCNPFIKTDEPIIFKLFFSRIKYLSLSKTNMQSISRHSLSTYSKLRLKLGTKRTLWAISSGENFIMPTCFAVAMFYCNHKI